jgi:peptidoglycan/LPS O-acetylase OafA/YrhL
VGAVKLGKLGRFHASECRASELSCIVAPLSSNPSRTSHLPALDGLRGLALLGVLLFHANGALPGGYLGVDLFFVLSGFLITRLLLAEHDADGRIALSSFWVRRARRLFPALLSLMPAIALYGRLVARPDALPGLRADAVATLAYVANWRAILEHRSYWQMFRAPSPLEHMWSLSIEEQFYVVWPVIVALVLRHGTRRALLAVTGVLMALSMTAMLAFYRPEDPSSVYLGTHTRAAGILAGAALAIVLSTRPVFARGTVRVCDGIGAVAATGLGVAWCRLDGQSTLLYHGGFWLTEAAALVLIVCASMGAKSAVARVLSFAPLRALGTVSYGAYLWHWPVDLVLSPERVHIAGAWLHVVQLAVTFAIATPSYLFLERPIRTRGLPFGRPVHLVPAAVALAIFLVVRATGARPLPLPPPPRVVAVTSAPQPALSPFHVLMLGDSTANSLGWGLRGLQQPGLVVDLGGKDGCTLLADTCGGSDWATQVNDLHPDAVLVFVGGAFLHGITVGSEWQEACHAEWDRRFEETLVARLHDLRELDADVWAVTVPYALGPWELDRIRDEVDCINASVVKAARSVADVRVLDLASRLCPKGVCERELDGVPIRPDGAHYAIDGARAVSRWVTDEIER